MPNLDLIPTSEAAALLGVHVRTVHRHVRAGDLTPTVKVPGLRGALMFDRRDVELLRLKRDSSARVA